MDDDAMRTVLSMWAAGDTMAAIGEVVGISRNAVSGRITKWGLFGHQGRVSALRMVEEDRLPATRCRDAAAAKERGPRLPPHRPRREGARRTGSSQRRFDTPLGHGGRKPLEPDHPAAVEGRTTWPHSLVASADSPRLLVSGINSRKIGRQVTKGPWRGMPIYTLTLEERATCPRSCGHWLTCYGRNMPFARRHRADGDLSRLLMAEIAMMQRRHPRGYVVRLHVLGDFPDRAYAEMWAGALELMPALRIFGYTAHEPGSPVGLVLSAMNEAHPDRCALRFSGLDDDHGGAVVVETADATRHIVCPAQTGGTECCATCGLCWHTTRTIAFIGH